MREKPYCSGVNQEKLDSMQDEYRRKLCGRIDKLLNVSGQYGESCQAWESAWADFTYAVTTLFDGNDPKVMRIVMEEVIALLKVTSSGHYPKSIIGKLEVLLEQDSVWIDEDTLSVDSMDEAYHSDDECFIEPHKGILHRNTFFDDRDTVPAATLTPEQARDPMQYLTCSLAAGGVTNKRRVGYNYITPEKIEGEMPEEKKTISPDEPERKKRRATDNSCYLSSRNWYTNSTPVVTPEIKKPNINQDDVEEDSDMDIPPLIFTN